MNKKTIILFASIAFLIILAIYGAFAFIDLNKSVSNEDFNKLLQKTPSGAYEVKQEAEAVKAIQERKLRNIREVYKDMHLMVNSIVFAEEIWGKEEITEEKINRLLLEVMASDYDNKQELINILARWKDGDFNKAAEDHNYVWSKLDGTVGEATAVNWSKIPAWATKKNKK